MRNFCKILIIVIIIFFAKNTFASIEITEVMYDVSGTDTNREWVEIYNNSSSAVDINKWYFFSDNTKHTLAGNTTLGANSYAVIVQNADKFRLDYPDFSGTIYDSSWTGLNNEGEVISLKDPDLNVVNTVNYNSNMGANGDGKSLQKIDGEWVASNPTPSRINTKNDDSNNGDQNKNQESTNTTSSSSTDKTKVVAPEAPRVITTKIIAKNNVSTRIGFQIEASTIGYKKEKLDSGKFVWSFGDGFSYEESVHKPFEYAYQYAGDYVLTLTYYESTLSTKPIATDSMIISVVDPELFIVKVGDSSDPYVEIKNQSENKMSLAGWVLNSNSTSFKLPIGMAILPNKSIVLSSKATHFSTTDIEHLYLYAPNGSLVSTYPSVKNIELPINKVKNSSNNYNSNYQNQKINSNSEIDLNNITAKLGDKKIPNNYLPILGLVVIIALGVTAIVFANKKTNLDHDEIGGINASDIKIIE
ncbi:lamin tail domain-containing protein [Candidatus Nomurabacteria bacterium]|nr:lamin tail domain-containing protein [Candidatus Nomurabacteria bacterium]